MENVIKLYGSTSAAGVSDALASAEIAKTGFIEAMSLEIAADGGGTFAGFGQMEVSFGSKSGFATNDTRQAIGGLETDAALFTAGATNNARQIALDGLRIPVQPGEKVYLHVNNSGLPTTIRARAWLYLKTQ
jgi:predicted porin